MQHVQLDLNHDNFYCPVTGFHMLSEEHYEASPANGLALQFAANELTISHDAMASLLQRLVRHATQRLASDDTYYGTHSMPHGI